MEITINLSEILVKCYNKVEKAYFDSNFNFNYSLLVLNMGELNKTLEKLTEYLDEVEINLFY